MSEIVGRHFCKIFVLSAASSFEHAIQQILVDFVAQKSGNNQEIVSFFKKKAIAMQYHTFFNWGEKDDLNKPGKNANVFLSLFGEDFKKSVIEEINKDPKLETSIRAFLEIGHIRNILVHNNFGEYQLVNKNTDDILTLYRSGLAFVEFIRSKLIGRSSHSTDAQGA